MWVESNISAWSSKLVAFWPLGHFPSTRLFRLLSNWRDVRSITTENVDSSLWTWQTARWTVSWDRCRIHQKEKCLTYNCCSRTIQSFLSNSSFANDTWMMAIFLWTHLPRENSEISRNIVSLRSPSFVILGDSRPLECSENFFKDRT